MLSLRELFPLRQRTCSTVTLASYHHYMQVLMLEMLVRSAFILNRMAHRHVRFLGAQLVHGPGTLQQLDTSVLSASSQSGNTNSVPDQCQTLSMSESLLEPANQVDAHGELPFLHDRSTLRSTFRRRSLRMDLEPARESCINLYLSLQGGQCVVNVLVDTSSLRVIETIYRPGGILTDRWVYKDWICWQDQLWHPGSIHHWSRGQVVQELHTGDAQRLSMSGTAPFDMCGFKSRPSGEHVQSLQSLIPFEANSHTVQFGGCHHVDPRLL